MSATAAGITTVVAIVSTGLVAGMFFGWSVTVIPGTKLVDDRTYIETMQSINRAIINPAFVVPFIGTPIVLGAAAFMQARTGHARAASWLIAAAVVYVIGVLGVTVGANVPLNNALDSFALAGERDASIVQRRQSYERLWNRWHHVRTAAAIAAFGFASIAALADSE